MWDLNPRFIVLLLFHFVGLISPILAVRYLNASSIFLLFCLMPIIHLILHLVLTEKILPNDRLITIYFKEYYRFYWEGHLFWSLRKTNSYKWQVEKIYGKDESTNIEGMEAVNFLGDLREALFLVTWQNDKKKMAQLRRKIKEQGQVGENNLKRLTSLAAYYRPELTIGFIIKYHEIFEFHQIVGEKYKLDIFPCAKFLYSLSVQRIALLLHYWTPGFWRDVYIGIFTVPFMETPPDATKAGKKAAAVLGNYGVLRNNWPDAWKILKGRDRNKIYALVTNFIPLHKSLIFTMGGGTDVEIAQLLFEFLIVQKFEHEKPVQIKEAAQWGEKNDEVMTKTHFSYFEIISPEVKEILNMFVPEKAQRIRTLIYLELRKQSEILSGTELKNIKEFLELNKLA